MKKDDVIEDSDAKQFRLDCRTLTQMMKKLFARSSLKQAVVRYCRIFDPKVIASYSKGATKKALKSLLLQLLNRKLITQRSKKNKKTERFQERTARNHNQRNK